MKYNETDDLLLGVVNGPEYNRTVTAYVVNGTANIDGVYYYIGHNTNTNNEVKLKLYPGGTAEIIKEEIK